LRSPPETARPEEASPGLALASLAAIVYWPALRERPEKDLPAETPINWRNALTLLSVAILVGTELVGAGAAAGWAIGGLFQFGEIVTHALEAIFVICALIGLTYFLRAALQHEPIRG
jgi:hypothetical protein